MDTEVAEVESIKVMEVESRLIGAAKELLKASIELSMLALTKDGMWINPRHFDTVAVDVTRTRRNLLITKLELQERHHIF